MKIHSTAYREKVYAGVLGKVIGVYLGRPFEGWHYNQIQQRLGDINYYVHDQLNVPLIVTDDDISGTFTFLRSIADHHYAPSISARQIGESWLNYLIEEKTILWWGGMGNSTEHTAYLRLKSGINAPESGSIARNGKVVAEQIGAQIFIDGWAMIAPGDPDRAAHFARTAASVSHDGEAILGAVSLAVMESLAFIESSTEVLLDTALSYLPAQSIIYQLISDIRNWHAGERDWRETRKKIEVKYGYDKYGGNCHMVPNHGLIIHGLLHGQDDFSLAMKIINTCGWDTDCNSGNLGCLLGIQHGLAGIDAGKRVDKDWRGPIADRIYIPTADPSWGISDCVKETVNIVNTAARLNDLPIWAPKDDAQFHFDLPGSVQGFHVIEGEAAIDSVSGQSRTGQYALKLSCKDRAAFGTPVFAPSKDIAKRFETAGYALLASPLLYPGQILSAEIIATGNSMPTAHLYTCYYGENDQRQTILSNPTQATGKTAETLTLKIPDYAHPVYEIGILLPQGGEILLDRISWTGEPSVNLDRPAHKGTMWRRSWVSAVDQFSSWSEPYRLVQNKDRGLLIQGTREWRNYTVRAQVTPHLAAASGLAIRVQGLNRYYAFLLTAPGELRLIKRIHHESCLARLSFDWQFGNQYALWLRCDGPNLTAGINEQTLFEVTDHDLDAGGIGLVIEEGRCAFEAVSAKSDS
ncbi:MAG: ADP-ribosylglycohydrolase family protein [Pseudomonadota bacterium]|nr:ADP-ribosylglycohydrolase family protein [Pseudomonadota bacterium]MEC8822157.1 ADP-ribosylglycohydrolase family protein [Pseudomonadota bacterium]